VVLAGTTAIVTVVRSMPFTPVGPISGGSTEIGG
jgi:hypothetical protein